MYISTAKMNNSLKSNWNFNNLLILLLVILVIFSSFVLNILSFLKEIK